MVYYTLYLGYDKRQKSFKFTQT